MTSLCILYVEDSPPDREMFMRLIRVAGAARGVEIEIQAVSTLAEIGAGPLCDCLLLDLSLANGGRTSTMQWIMDHHQRMPPVFVLSGYCEHDEDCLRFGAEDFMDKADAVTFSPILIDRLRYAVIRHRARRLAA